MLTNITFICILVKRESNNRFKKLAVSQNFELSALEFSKVLYDRKTETAAFRIAGFVAAHETLSQGIDVEVQFLGGGVFDCDDGFIGKSYIAEKFARENFKSYILIDFNRASRQVQELFENYLDDLDTFFLYLSGYYNVRLYPGESLIIFDEVQMFPRARGAIKYLVADGRYAYLETGSLMSIRKNVRDIVIPSEEEHVYMYPMDFEEFLWVMENETLMPLIRSCYEKKRPMGQAMHRKAMDYKEEDGILYLPVYMTPLL